VRESGGESIAETGIVDAVVVTVTETGTVGAVAVTVTETGIVDAVAVTVTTSGGGVPADGRDVDDVDVTDNAGIEVGTFTLAIRSNLFMRSRKYVALHVIARTVGIRLTSTPNLSLPLDLCSQIDVTYQCDHLPGCKNSYCESREHIGR
jgi:hypothetical protein